MTVDSMKDNTEDDNVDTNIDNPLTEEEVSKNKSDEDEAQTEKKNEGLESEVEAEYIDINTDTILQTAAEETISALEHKVAELKEELSKEKSQAEETINIMKYDVAISLEAGEVCDYFSILIELKCNFNCEMFKKNTIV